MSYDHWKTTNPADAELSPDPEWDDEEFEGHCDGEDAVRERDGRVDPRDPDPSRPGIFRDHNCWKCQDGKLPCAKGHTLNCEYPHARND